MVSSTGPWRAAWEEEEGQGEDRRCFLLWESSGRQLTGALKDLLFHPPPQPLCRHIPFWANPERDPVKRFRNLISIFRHLSCCKELYSLQDLPPEICIFTCKHLSHTKDQHHWSIEVNMLLPERMQIMFKKITCVKIHKLRRMRCSDKFIFNKHQLSTFYVIPYIHVVHLCRHLRPGQQAKS